MIYSHSAKLGFIHVPKAAGTSIRLTLAKSLPDCFESPSDHHHATAEFVRDRILGRDAFASIRWFAVVRNPVDSIAASYLRTRQVAAVTDRRSVPKIYAEYLDFAMSVGFAEYARTSWIGTDGQLKQGGFIRTYLSDQSGVIVNRVLRFDRLEIEWQRLRDDWNLSLPDLPKINATERGDKVDIAAELRAEIEAHCAGDVDYLTRIPRATARASAVSS